MHWQSQGSMRETGTTTYAIMDSLLSRLSPADTFNRCLAMQIGSDLAHSSLEANSKIIQEALDQQVAHAPTTLHLGIMCTTASPMQ